MTIRFGSITHYTGPAALVSGILKMHPPDHFFRAKIQDGNEGLYISGVDLLLATQDAFSPSPRKMLLFEDPQLLSAYYPEHQYLERPTHPLSAEQKRLTQKLNKLHKKFSAVFKSGIFWHGPLQPTRNPFLVYYDKALQRDNARDMDDIPITEVALTQLGTTADGFIIVEKNTQPATPALPISYPAHTREEEIQPAPEDVDSTRGKTDATR